MCEFHTTAQAMRVAIRWLEAQKKPLLTTGFTPARCFDPYAFETEQPGDAAICPDTRPSVGSCDAQPESLSARGDSAATLACSDRHLPDERRLISLVRKRTMRQ